MSVTGVSNVKTYPAIAAMAQAEETTASRFFSSGAVTQASFSGLTTITGDKVETPQWENTGAGQFGLGENAEITVGNIDYHTGYFPIARWYKADGYLDIAQMMLNSSIRSELSRQMGIKSAQAWDTVCAAVLEGCAAANTDNVVSYTNAVVAATDIVSLENVFSDMAQDMRTAYLVMRSETLIALKKIAAGSFVSAGYGGTDKANEIISTGMFDSFMGHPIIVSNRLTVSGSAYPIYLVGQGAIRYADQTPYTVESDRVMLAQKDVLVAKWHRVVGIVGMSYKGTINASLGVTDTDLKTSTNWELKAEAAKLVKVAKITTKVA